MFLSNYTGIAAFGFVAFVAAWDLAGDVEGRVFPVIGPLTITDAGPYPPPEYRTIAKGHAEKFRDCNFERVEWFLGPRGGRRVQVQMGFADPPQVRVKGALHWDGILVWMDADDLAKNSHADALHKCPYRPWLTRTAFYDPPEKRDERLEYK